MVAKGKQLLGRQEEGLSVWLGELEVTMGRVMEDALQPYRKLELWVWQGIAE